MTPTHLDTYQTRHPAAVLVTADLPHAAAGLNALFDLPLFERDEDVVADMVEEPVDLSTDAELKGFRAGPPTPRGENRAKLRWRAPIETLCGPLTLWRETVAVSPNVASSVAARAALGRAPLPDDHPALQPTTYTAYTLVCELDRVLGDDLAVLQSIATRHNATLGVDAHGDKTLVQLAFVR